MNKLNWWEKIAVFAISAVLGFWFIVLLMWFIRKVLG